MMYLLKSISKNYIIYLISLVLIFTVSIILDLKISLIIIMISILPILQVLKFNFEIGIFILLWISNTYYITLYNFLEIPIRLFILITPLLLYQIIINQYNKKFTYTNSQNFFKYNRFYLLFLMLLSLLTARIKFQTLLWIIYFLQAFLWYDFLKVFLDSHKKIVSSIMLLNISSTFHCIFGIKQMLIGLRPFGLIESANSLIGLNVFYIIVNLFLIKNTKNLILNIFSVTTIILSVIVLIGTQSRGGQIGFLFSLIIYLLIYNINNIKKLAYSFVILLSFISVFVVTIGSSFFQRYQLVSTSGIDVSTLDRFGMWIAAIKLFLQSPIYGIGINNYYYFYTQFHTFFKYFNLKQLRVAHNIYLNTLAETGLIGFIILLLLLFSIIKYLIFLLFKSNTNQQGKDLIICITCYFIYFLVHNLFDCIWTSVNHQTILFQGVFILSLLTSVERIYKNENKI